MLNETSDMAFKAYLTSKIQGWLLRWGRDEPAAPPPLPAPAQGSPALQRRRVHRRCKFRMTTRTGGGLEGGPQVEDGLGRTMLHWHWHIASLDVSDAEDEPGLVEEDNISLSPI